MRASAGELVLLITWTIADASMIFMLLMWRHEIFLHAAIAGWIVAVVGLMLYAGTMALVLGIVEGP
jgi:hypothetical protein